MATRWIIILPILMIFPCHIGLIRNKLEQMLPMGIGGLLVGLKPAMLEPYVHTCSGGDFTAVPGLLLSSRAKFREPHNRQRLDTCASLVRRLFLCNVKLKLGWEFGSKTGCALGLIPWVMVYDSMHIMLVM
jgi:hypothetical protein